MAHRIDNHWLSVLFACTLLLVSFKTYRQARGGARAANQPEHSVHPCMRDTTSGRFIWTSSCTRALALSGTVAGLLSGLLGEGGGFVMVPALQRYTNLAIQSIVATSLAVIALVSVSGVVASAVSGGMNWAVAPPFSAGDLGGMMGGRMVSARLAGPHLQIGFAAVAGTVAIGMIAKSLL